MKIVVEIWDLGQQAASEAVSGAVRVRKASPYRLQVTALGHEKP